MLYRVYMVTIFLHYLLTTRKLRAQGLWITVRRQVEAILPQFNVGVVDQQGSEHLNSFAVDKS